MIFTAMKDRVYTVQFKDAIEAANRTDLTSLSLPGTNAQVMILDVLATNRLYRLRQQ